MTPEYAKEVQSFVESYQPPFSHRLVRLKDLLKLLGIARSTAYERMNPESKYFDPNFPKPVQLSLASTSSIAFVEAEIQTYIAQLIAVSRSAEKGEVIKQVPKGKCALPLHQSNADNTKKIPPHFGKLNLH